MSVVSIVYFAIIAVVYTVLSVCRHLIADEQKYRRLSDWLILLAGYVFIVSADWRFLPVILLTTLITWIGAKRSKYAAAAISVLLISLAVFKYLNFGLDTYYSLVGKNFSGINIILPAGISFYTFSAISYISDVKKGKLEARRFFDVALYLSFFPKLTCGPIPKSIDFFGQLDCKRTVDSESLSSGIQIFMFGLFKKIVLADNLSVFVNQVYAAPKVFGSMTVFAAVLAYAFEIYFDFSGYSDMAVGSARIIGFELPRNFNLPYISKNVTEFWKRWHISLSEWLQEYLYIPLGGNRKGTARTYLNLIITMVLGGLWHGASWNYIVWGLVNGIALAVHKIWMSFAGRERKESSKLGTVLSVGLTFLFTSFSWVIFRTDSLGQAREIFVQIFSFRAGIEQPYFWLFVSVAVYLICLGAAARISKKKGFDRIEGTYIILDLSKFWNLVLFFVFCGLILSLAYTGVSPFIYGKY